MPNRREGVVVLGMTGPEALLVRKTRFKGPEELAADLALLRTEDMRAIDPTTSEQQQQYYQLI